jgi:hypothetical protein
MGIKEMNKNLPTINENKDLTVSLNKTKSLMNITNKILAKSNKTVTTTSVGTKELTIDNEYIWQDLDTGLIWQRKIDDERYTWQEAFEYAKKLNSQNFGGYDDWRLPTIDELCSLGNIKLYRHDDRNGNRLKENNPLNDYNTWNEWKETNWDKGYDNPNADFGKNFIKEALLDSIKKQKYPWYWSSTSFDDNNLFAWSVNFYFGSTYCHNKSFSYYVRCVRGRQ